MRVTYISGTRADYGLMRVVLNELRNDPFFDVHVCVTGMHLREKFGHTMDEIRRDSWKLLPPLDTLHTGDTPLEMTRSLGQTIDGMTQLFRDHPSDLLLLLGDRDEQLAAAIAGNTLGIPLAQVHAGERSGSIDESNRHAISHLSHLLFTACEENRQRLVRMGEEPSRVFNVGAPANDDFVQGTLPSLADIERQLQIHLVPQEYIVLVQHSVTTAAADSGVQIAETLSALQDSKRLCIAFTPNADAGHEAILRSLQEAQTKGQLHLVTHLERPLFLALLRNAACLIGNSSSGIIEAPFLALPVVNVGNRQEGRFRGQNVIDVGTDRKSIAAALRKALEDNDFRTSLSIDRFIYGDGTASKQIAATLKRAAENPSLLKTKRIGVA